jgi:hypothetical protein
MTNFFPQLLKLRLADTLWLCHKRTQQKQADKPVINFQRSVPQPGNKHRTGRSLNSMAKSVGEKRRKLIGLATGCQQNSVASSPQSAR